MKTELATTGKSTMHNVNKNVYIYKKTNKSKKPGRRAIGKWELSVWDLRGDDETTIMIIMQKPIRRRK